jgi:hypothetical protein
VEYARHTKLSVRRNDDMSWDYTLEDTKSGGGQKDAGPAASSGRSDRPVLLTEPRARESRQEDRSRSDGGGRRHMDSDRSRMEASTNSRASGGGMGGAGMGGGMGAAGGMGMGAAGMGAFGGGGLGSMDTMAAVGGGAGILGPAGGPQAAQLATLANTLAGIDPVKLAAVITTLTSGSLLGLAGGGGGLMGAGPSGGMAGGGYPMGGGGGMAAGSGLLGEGGMGGLGMGGPGMGMGGPDPRYAAADYYGHQAVGGVGGGGGYAAEGRGPVVMLYGLEPTKFNCSRLFNLLCLYGNVVRIMFLKNKDGTAMVEMANPDAAAKVIENISGTTIFGSAVRADWSKKESVNVIRAPYQLPDGTDNYVGYESDRNNRFDTPERAARNRILPPGVELLFFNIPQLADDELERVFTDAGAAPPARIKWFPGGRGKAASGIVEFATVEEAVEALVLCNHTQVEGNKGARYPFVMKLSFSEGAVRARRNRSSWGRSRSRSPRRDSRRRRSRSEREDGGSEDRDRRRGGRDRR